LTNKISLKDDAFSFLLLMLDQNAIEQWRRTISSPYQLDMSHAVLDCSSASDSSYRTPERLPMHVVCPPAPKRKRALSGPYDALSPVEAGRILFKMKNQETQTDLSLGTSRVKGMAMHLLRIHYGCSSCRTLIVGEMDQPPTCSFCGTPMRRSTGTNIGLYHLVPYFE
jgi:hypothetical protein